MKTCTSWRLTVLPRVCLLLIGVLFITGCPDSKVEVRRVDKEMPAKKMKGVFYALPRTLVLVKIPVTRTDKLPGKYEKFARCFFPDEDDGRITSASTEFEVGDDITFEAKGEPDPAEIFMVNTKAGLFQTKSLTMVYTGDGVLSSAKAETKDESIDFAISTFQTLASIGGAISTARQGSPISTGNLFGLQAKKVADLEPNEYLFEANALKARSEMRKCYNYYVTATASRTRAAADLLGQTIEAITAAGGGTVTYNEATLKSAEDTAKKATIANNRAAEFADQAIANPPQPTPSPDGSDSANPNPFAANNPPNKSQRPKAGNKSRSKQTSKAKESEQSKARENDPLQEGRDKERSAVGFADDVVKKKGLADAALADVKKATDDADNVLKLLPPSANKDVAVMLLKSTKKALEGAGKTIVEARDMAEGSDGIEFGDGFKAGYFEASPFSERIKSLQDEREKALLENSRDMQKDTLELRLKELDALINTYKEIYFLGRKKTDTWSATYQHLPAIAKSSKSGDSIEDPVPLFKFSETGGVCGGQAVEGQGIKINPDFQIKTKCATNDTIYLNIEKFKNVRGDADGQFSERVQGAGFPEGHGALTDKRGFYYRIPYRTRFRITVGLEPKLESELARAVLPVAQLGVIASLPVSTGGRRTSYNLTLDPSTGALLNFELGSDAAIQKAMLDEAETGVKSIVDAKDPLTRLKRRKEFLETLKAINDAETELEKAREEKDKKANSNNSNSNPPQ